jgi:hypothetical protein
MTKFKTINSVQYKIGDRNIENSGEVYYFEEKDTWYTIAKGRIMWDPNQNKYRLISDVISDMAKKQKIKVVNGVKDGQWTFKEIFNEQLPPLADFTVEGYPVLLDTVPDYYFDNRNIKYDLKYRYRGESETKTPYRHYNINSYSFTDDSYLTATFAYSKSPKVISPKNVEIFNQLSNYFNKNSIGIEIESCSGYIPESILGKHGFIPVRDGSIGGHEYISVPFSSSAEDLSNIYESFKRFKRFIRADQYCSLHYHIGNIPKNSNFVVALYTLVYSLQQELHQICLPYKKSAKYLATKDHYKDHCKSLLPLNCTSKKLSVDEKMNNIYNFFNQTEDEHYNPGFLKRHSLYGENKWNINSRYYILNLIPLLFRGGHGTAEFRIHHGTVNEYQSFYFLCICNALVEFSKLYHEEVNSCKEKYCLEDILERIYGESIITTALISYINQTKLLYTKLMLSEDIYGNRYNFTNNFWNTSDDHLFEPSVKLFDDSTFNYKNFLKDVEKINNIKEPDFVFKDERDKLEVLLAAYWRTDVSFFLDLVENFVVDAEDVEFWKDKITNYTIDSGDFINLAELFLTQDENCVSRLERYMRNVLQNSRFQSRLFESNYQDIVRLYKKNILTEPVSIGVGDLNLDEIINNVINGQQ